jgi:flagellar biosynthetic protein FliR
VFARCLGVVFRTPGLSHPSVPAPLRAGFAYAVSSAFALRYRDSTSAFGAALVPALLVEISLGAAIGIAASALYDGAYSGGRLVDDYVGIRISVPTAGVVAGAGFGRLWSLAFTAMFFVLGGYAVVFLAIDRSFMLLPPGTVLAAHWAPFAVTLPATLLSSALIVAGPAIAIAFVAQLALAALGRIVPRFGTFPLTFPIVLGCALLATIAALPIVLPIAGRPILDMAPLFGN